MPEIGDDIEEPERVAAMADRQRDAWQRTIDDARELAAEREDAGWETALFPALDTATEPPEDGVEGRYGLVHVVPGNYADEARRLSADAVDAYDVYRAENDGRVFLVTELLDTDAELAVFVVASYELRYADGLIEAATDDDRMYSHFRKLDGTHLASVEHAEPEKFFPDPALSA